jgi:hypothetical protein
MTGISCDILDQVPSGKRANSFRDKPYASLILVLGGGCWVGTDKWTFDRLKSLCITEDVAVSRDEPADFARNWIVAVTFGISDVPAIDVYARSGFEGDIVDPMNAAVTENRYASFLVDSLVYLLNPGYFGVGTVVCSTKEGLSFFAFIDSDQSPSEVVVYWGGLTRVPDPTNDGVCFVLRHLEKIHREPILPWSERFSRDGTRRTYQFL